MRYVIYAETIIRRSGVGRDNWEYLNTTRVVEYTDADVVIAGDSGRAFRFRLPHVCYPWTVIDVAFALVHRFDDIHPDSVFAQGNV